MLMLPTPPRPVSGREQEVLALLACGRTNTEIAAELGISDRTVQTHLRNLMAKAEARNRTHLAVKAIRLGLTPMPELDDLD